MALHYAYPHFAVKAESHTLRKDNCGMARIATIKVLAENAKAFRTAAKLTQPQVAEAASRHNKSIDQGTISRIERASMAASIEVLEALAAGLDVAPWQLLVPEADPSNPPILREASQAERDLWKKLQQAAKAMGINQ